MFWKPKGYATIHKTITTVYTNSKLSSQHDMLLRMASHATNFKYIKADPFIQRVNNTLGDIENLIAQSHDECFDRRLTDRVAIAKHVNAMFNNYMEDFKPQHDRLYSDFVDMMFRNSMAECEEKFNIKSEFSYIPQ